MARSDLLINLVRASVSGDKGAVRAVVETIIAEEKGKQHLVLADRLARVIQATGNATRSVSSISDSHSKEREYLSELIP